MSKLTITLLGAGGKMGMRILHNLVKHDYTLLLYEISPHGIAAIQEQGFSVTPYEKAVPESDLVIMAVPDALISKISQDVVPMMKRDATMILLDPAAAYAEEVALRDDCTFVVTHPCHPALFVEQETPEARADVFGGMAAKQDIVIALLQGKEKYFLQAEGICKEMFAPVVMAHRITVEHMAILEPAMAEVVAITAVSVLKEALDTVVECGVPEEAARAFLLGHTNLALGVYFKKSNPISEAAQIACDYGYQKVFKENWKDVFTKEAIREVLQKMLHLNT